MKRSRIVWVLGMIFVLGQGSVFAEEKHPAGYKNPKAALGWGYLLPGAGHIYAGESGKGWLVMATSVGALAAGTIVTLNSGDDSELSAAEDSFLDQDFGAPGAGSSTVKAEETDMVPAYVGIGVFAVGWIYSVMDAPKAAQRSNRKKGLALRPVLVEPYIVAGKTRREYGLKLTVRL